jgi:small-conductance mechanosensitive channel
MLSAAIFAWGLVAGAADPVATEGHAGATTAPARAGARTAKAKKGKGAPSASAEELASAAPPPSAAPADSVEPPVAPSASAEVGAPAMSAAPEPAPAALAPPPSAPAPVPTASAAAGPAPSASAHGKATAGPTAKIHDAVAFSVKTGHAGKTAEERARAATEALGRAFDAPDAQEVRVVRQGDAAQIFAGAIPIIDLYAADAEAAGAADLDAYAADIAGRTREVIKSEKKRSAIASTVFSFAFVIFFALISFYVLRKIGEFFERARKWALDSPDRISGIKFQSQVVVGPAAARGGVLVALILGRSVAQIGVVYLWLVFSLSLFQTTRPYTEKLTGLITTPLSTLAGKIAESLPVAVLAALSAVAVYILLRFVQLFFEAVERRQTQLAWLPADLAEPTSVLVRLAIVVVAVVYLGPVLIGDQQGSLAKTGTISLLAFALASTPLLANVVVGGLVVYGRRVRVGQHVELGKRTGKVLTVGLFDVVLQDADGCHVHVPHLNSVLHPTRILGESPRVAVEFSVSPAIAPATARKVLHDAAAAIGNYPVVELASIDADAQHYRVTVLTKSGVTASDVRIALAEAMKTGGVTLGRGHRRAESA